MNQGPIKTASRFRPDKITHFITFVGTHLTCEKQPGEQQVFRRLAGALQCRRCKITVPVTICGGHIEIHGKGFRVDYPYGELPWPENSSWFSYQDHPDAGLMFDDAVDQIDWSVANTSLLRKAYWHEFRHALKARRPIDIPALATSTGVSAAIISADWQLVGQYIAAVLGQD